VHALVLLPHDQAARRRADPGDGEQWLSSTVRGSSRARVRRASSSCSCTATAPTATTSSISAGRGRGWCPRGPSAPPLPPEPCGQAPVGRQWFPLTFRDPDERWSGVNKATPVLATFLDAELKRRNLPPSALALVGFSQGTMMALHVGLRRAAAPFAIVGYS